MSRFCLEVDSVLGAGDQGPFVGRATKMSRLIEIYERVRGGQAEIISIKGESGIGKTRMAKEFVDWAITQGADVVQGRACEGGKCWPYQPLIEMLKQRSERGTERQRIQGVIVDPVDEMLNSVLAEMHNYTLAQPSAEGYGNMERKRLFESFTLLGQALAERAPLVMFIDDIHWSDCGSLDMLQYASRRWIESNTPILVLLSLRTEALVMLPTFAAWLASLERDLHASSFILNPLTLEDTVEFVYAIAVEKATYLEGFGRWLHGETGGKPFYMVELLKMLLEREMLMLHEREDGGWGIDFEPAMGNTDALERILLPGVRAVVSLRLKQLAPLNQALTAGDEAQRLFALHDAVTFYEKALHLLVEQQEQGKICSDVSAIEHLYLQLGHVYELLNERERAWKTYQSMFLLAKKMNITTLVIVALSQLAAITLHEKLNLQEQARMLFQEENSDDCDPTVLAENEWQLAQFSFHRFDVGAALLHGKRALQLAREVDVPELIARALFAFACAQMLVSAWGQVETLAEEARILYEQQRNSVMEAICLVQIAQAKFNCCEPQEGVITARGAYLTFTQAKYGWWRIYTIHHLVAGLLDIGAYAEALALAQEVLALARTYSVALLLCLSLTALGRVQRALMDLVSAYALHCEAMAIFPMDMPHPVIEMLAAELCADCALAGEWTEAQSYAIQSLEHRSNNTCMYVGLTRWYETEILIRTGYNERASVDAERFGALIGKSSRYQIPYLRVLAVLALWRGEFEQTYLYLQEAGVLAEEIGLPGEHWSIEATRGELYLAQGDKAAARTAFEHASEIVQALAERIEDGQVRAQFLATRQVQRVIKHAG